jgi:predicted RNA-binding protein with PUA-like domain
MAYWLMKSEPDTYSIDDLAAKTPAMWEGCRNWTVRNFMREDIKKGDLAFFYHSSCEPPGVVGVMEVVSEEAYPDPTQFDPKSDYYDAKSTKEKPRWLVVDVKFLKKWDRMVTLKEMRENPALEGMLLLRRGQRLSVMPVSEKEWKIVHEMAGEKA